MIQINSQFRVDDICEVKAKAILKKYEAKHQAKYCIVKETASQSQKQHLQGWVTHTHTDNSYRQGMSRHYKHLGTHQKCFTLVKDFPVYVAYILNNDSKPVVSFDSVITNYTEDEFNQFQQHQRFTRPVSYKSKSKDWYAETINHLEETCVDDDGTINYDQLPVEFLKNAPKRLNPRIAMDFITGMAIRLEDKYPQNVRTKNWMLRQLERQADGLFDLSMKKFIKTLPINKKDAATYDSQSSWEASSQEEEDLQSSSCPSVTPTPIHR